MSILENIEIRLDPESLERELRLDRTGRSGSARELVDTAAPLIRAAAVFTVSYIDEKLEDAVVVSGTRFKSRVMRKNLETVERVFPYAITIGSGLEARASEAGDPLEQYYLDAVGNLALRRALHCLKDELCRRYGLEKLSYMSPGSLEDWPIEEQGPLFSLLGGAEKRIGVKLTENFLMIPKKSLSGIYFPTDVPFFSCQLCPRQKCPGRKAPYSRERVREYGLQE